MLTLFAPGDCSRSGSCCLWRSASWLSTVFVDEQQFDYIHGDLADHETLAFNAC
jgi:hypothetical protein